MLWRRHDIDITTLIVGHLKRTGAPKLRELDFCLNEEGRGGQHGFFGEALAGGAAPQLEVLTINGSRRFSAEAGEALTKALEGGALRGLRELGLIVEGDSDGGRLALCMLGAPHGFPELHRLSSSFDLGQVLSEARSRPGSFPRLELVE
jgi:hypothetical protein